MASAFVQVANTEAQTSATPSVAINGVAAGSTLVLCLSCANSATRTVTSISDGTNSWAETSPVLVHSGDVRSTTIWHAYNVAAGNFTITVTMNASAVYSLSALEFSGLTTTDPKDKVISETVTGTSLEVGPTAETAQDAEMLVGFGFGVVDGRDFNAVSGWDKRVALVASATYHAVWTKSQSTKATQAITLTTNLNQYIGGHLITLKDAAAGGSILPLVAFGTLGGNCNPMMG